MRRHGAVLALCLLALAACGGAPQKDTFYRLPETLGATQARLEGGPLIYIPSFLADGLHGERPLVFAHDDGTTLEQYTYHYWVDSPRQLLQQALAERLRAAHRVTTTASADAAYTLRGRIVRFERRGTGKQGSAEVALEFELLSADTDVALFARSYSRSVPLADDTMSTSAGALGAAAEDILASLVGDLEAYWER